ncbi:hypothetical protein BSL78_01916 [Apostichopus japonicus]|uniref:Uncharacterized protein n=1 Tax=Stichopus japonicus TaxID=307972 RepID=A0A2G8LLK3_STIJA|nr:hypothetical protein BSL78_01916 [Apostichopus japonicus]
MDPSCRNKRLNSRFASVDAQLIKQEPDKDGIVPLSDCFTSLRSLFDHLEGMTPEEDFLRFDINEDGFIDACEWTMVQFNNNSVREFVRLLDQADLDDNELLSMDEFIAIESSRLSKESPPSIASRKPSKYRHFVH